MMNRPLGPPLHGTPIQKPVLGREACRSHTLELPKEAHPPQDHSGPPSPPPNYTRQNWLAAAGLVAGATGGVKVGQFLTESPFFSLPTASLSLGAVGGLLGACLALHSIGRGGNQGNAPGMQTILASGTVGFVLGGTAGVLLGAAVAIYGSVASLGAVGAVAGLLGMGVISGKLSTGNG
jgi:hypothetical protein